MIVCDKKEGLFTLHTRNTTYQMKADSYRVLLHTYYGARIGGGNLSYLVRYTDRGFSPNRWTRSHRSIPPAVWEISVSRRLIWSWRMAAGSRTCGIPVLR